MKFLNFQLPDYMKSKLGREPRVRSIAEVHRIYLETKERYIKRSETTREIIEKIKKEIEPQDNYRKKRIVYFNQEARGEVYLRQYEISFEYGDDCYSTSIGDTRFKTRDEKLEFILSNQKAFELGQDFYEAKKIEDDAYRRSSRIKEYLWNMIEGELKKIKFPPFTKKTLLIQIEDTKYFVSVESSHYNYANFQWLNEFDDNIIHIS